VAPLAAFVLGVCLLQLQAQLPATAVLVGGVVLGVAAAAWGARAAQRSVALTAAVVAAFLVGFAYAGLRAQARLAEELPFADEGRDVRVTGVIATLPARLERGVRFEFEVESHDSGVAVPRRILLGWYSAVEPILPGERWTFVVRLRRPHGVHNPAGFDFEAWLLERDLRATGTVRPSPHPARADAMVWSTETAVERARAWLRERLAPHVEGRRYGGVLQALVFGEQNAITDRDWTLFNRTGISHLVSISGLHITMIAALAGGVVAALWRRSPRLLRRAPAQSAAIVISVIAAGLYALLAGWGVPAQRTVLMLATAAGPGSVAVASDSAARSHSPPRRSAFSIPGQ